MGKASSAKKVARASRAAGRPGASRNLGWPLMLAVIVSAGVALVVISAVQNEPAQAGPPTLADHWHAAYGVNVCGDFLPALTDAGEDLSGLHTHGDGLIHIHPFSPRFTGGGATLGTFGDTVGMELGDDSLDLADSDPVENGDDCDGEAAEVQVKVWEDAADTEGRLLPGDFADFAPQDGNVVTIAFAPEGAEIPKPPSVGTVPTDVEAPSPSVPVPPGADTPPGTDTLPPPGTDTGPPSSAPPTSAPQ